MIGSGASRIACRLGWGAAALALASGPTSAGPFPDLFGKLTLGQSVASAQRTLASGGAKIVLQRTSNALVRRYCPGGTPACIAKYTYVARLTARGANVRYRLQFTSPLTDNRLYQVSVVGPTPGGLTPENHIAQITKELDVQPHEVRRVFIYTLNDDGHVLRVTHVGDRFAALRYDPARHREDRIARERARRR